MPIKTQFSSKKYSPFRKVMPQMGADGMPLEMGENIPAPMGSINTIDKTNIPIKDPKKRFGSLVKAFYKK